MSFWYEFTNTFLTQSLSATLLHEFTTVSFASSALTDSKIIPNLDLMVLNLMVLDVELRNELQCNLNGNLSQARNQI